MIDTEIATGSGSDLSREQRNSSYMVAATKLELNSSEGGPKNVGRREREVVESHPRGVEESKISTLNLSGVAGRNSRVELGGRELGDGLEGAGVGVGGAEGVAGVEDGHGDGDAGRVALSRRGAGGLEAALGMAARRSGLEGCA